MHIQIDQSGRIESLTQNTALSFANKRKIKPDFSKNNIIFQSIGKKSKAHLAAYRVYKKEINPDKIIKAGDVLLLL